ncbi:MAG: tellurium resistance protein TerC [Candidatus Latescibacterota bacterium]|nr:MAG: tellurium resistance protein TerC [Candidatus Latescibacterota bacterium]
MQQILNVDNLVTLVLLIMLQAVLGFDNLLYIVLESKRAPLPKQKMVRRLGIGIAMVLRIVLLFGLIKAIGYFQDPVFSVNVSAVVGEFNLHSIIVLLGGVFLIYTATKEIIHMMGLEEIEHEPKKAGSVGALIFAIVSMNLIFSFDSILSAMALTDVFWVMAVAIIVGGGLMIWLSDSVAAFLQKNRMYEVLGLFILFIVGIMLLSEGGHLAHLHLFGHEITQMSKATFYFVIGVLVLTDVVQTRYRKRLMRLKQRSQAVLSERH